LILFCRISWRIWN